MARRPTHTPHNVGLNGRLVGRLRREASSPSNALIGFGRRTDGSCASRRKIAAKPCRSRHSRKYEAEGGPGMKESSTLLKGSDALEADQKTLQGANCLLAARRD
jgi:hypothetical protein